MDIHPQTAAGLGIDGRRMGADRAARGNDPAARALQRGDSPRHREPGRLLVGAWHADGRAEPLRRLGQQRERDHAVGDGVLELRRRPATARRPLPRPEGGAEPATTPPDVSAAGAEPRRPESPSSGPRSAAGARRCCASRRSCSPRTATRRPRRRTSPSASGSRAAASTTTSTRRRSCSSSSSRTSTASCSRASQEVLDSDADPLAKLRRLIELHVVRDGAAPAPRGADPERDPVAQPRAPGGRGRSTRRRTRRASRRSSPTARSGQIDPDIDPKLVTKALLGAGNWVNRWYREGGAWSPEDVSRDFARIFLVGLSRREASDRRRADRLRGASRTRSRSSTLEGLALDPVDQERDAHVRAPLREVLAPQSHRDDVDTVDVPERLAGPPQAPAAPRRRSSCPSCRRAR